MWSIGQTRGDNMQHWKPVGLLMWFVLPESQNWWDDAHWMGINAVFTHHWYFLVSKNSAGLIRPSSTGYKETPSILSVLVNAMGYARGEDMDGEVLHLQKSFNPGLKLQRGRVLSPQSFGAYGQRKHPFFTHFESFTQNGLGSGTEISASLSPPCLTTSRCRKDLATRSRYKARRALHWCLKRHLSKWSQKSLLLGFIRQGWLVSRWTL